MNFTREPIIETVITPREGCKLVIRNSKGNGQEDYFVEAVEVVSFGHSFFFRSLERPKSFLVPVSDYEILELKETRMVLKNVATERSIKIGGGREAHPRPSRENGEPREEPLSESRERQPERQSERQGERPAERPQDRPKRDKRRRGRRGRDRHAPQEMRDRPLPPDEHLPHHAEGHPEGEGQIPREEAIPEEVKAPSYISKLFPPPPTLIKETLSRYKPAESTESSEPKSFDESIFEHPTPKERGSDEDTHFED